MAGEAMTSKAVLDADAGPFIRSMGQAKSATEGLEKQMSGIGKLITGFGVLGVVSQLQGLVGLVKGTIDSLERDAVARVARLAGMAPGSTSQSVAARAQAKKFSIEAEGFSNPVGLVGKAIGVAGRTLATGALTLTGFSSAADEMAEQTREMIGDMGDFGARLRGLSADAAGTADNLQDLRQMTAAQASALQGVLMAQGRDGEAARLGQLAAGDNIAGTNRAIQEYNEAFRARMRDRVAFGALGN